MGITLAEELPFAHVVNRKCTDKVCANCMKSTWDRDIEGRLNRCVRCKFAHYCNWRCQKNDWPNHKIECSYLSGISPRVPESMPRLIGRIIAKLQRDGDNRPAFNGRLFASLESHAHDVEKDEEKRNGFIAIAHIIRDYVAPADMPSTSQIFDIFCKVLINALVVTDNCLNETGLAVYLGFSALDHSCKPDAIIIFDGARAILRSLNNDITNYSDKLRIPYCDLLDFGLARRETLKKQYNFVCNCEVCQDVEMDRQKFSLHCTKCNDGFCPFSPEDENPEILCKICGEKSLFNFDDLRKLYQRLTDHEAFLKMDLNELINLYHTCETVFSPYNVHLCKLAESIMTLALNNENYDESVRYAEKTLLCYRTYYPNGHPSCSVRMYEYAKLLMLQQNQQCLPVLKKAFEMICESHGPDSNFALETVKLLNNLKQRMPITSS